MKHLVTARADYSQGFTGAFIVIILYLNSIIMTYTHNSIVNTTRVGSLTLNSTTTRNHLLHTTPHRGLICHRYYHYYSSSSILRTMPVGSTRQGRASLACEASAEAYTPPSRQGGSTELSALEQFSIVIPDSFVHSMNAKAHSLKSGTVSRRIVAGIMANPTSFGRMKFSIEQARLFKRDGLGPEENDTLQVCKALVNVAGIMLEDIVSDPSGRVSIEVDPRVAYDTDALVAQGELIWSMCAENGISKDRILVQMPATWEAIEAAGRLELQGVETHLTGIYSYGQAVAACNHGVSVISVNVGRIHDWYDKNPGAARDPTGPRETQAMAKAGYGGPLQNPGIPLVKKIYTYIHHAGGKTKIIASGMRTKKETLALAGCDYLVVGEHILKSLASTSTLDGYNDGLSAQQQYAGTMSPAMSPDQAAASEVEKIFVASANFKDALGLIGSDLLSSDIERSIEDARRLEPIFMNRVGGQE